MCALPACCPQTPHAPRPQLAAADAVFFAVKAQHLHGGPGTAPRAATTQGLGGERRALAYSRVFPRRRLRIGHPACMRMHISAARHDGNGPCACAQHPAGKKRCVECGASETPQWRQGPTGWCRIFVQQLQQAPWRQHLIRGQHLPSFLRRVLPFACAPQVLKPCATHAECASAGCSGVSEPAGSARL